ncbi:MAG: hypothetical protein ACJ8GO_04850 [Ramlibacter sp.]
MFIVWGKKIVYRSIGHVADFCPVCREKQAFELKRVGSASHVYYISAGEGEPVGFERTCGGCGTSCRADPATYAAVAKARGSLGQLTAQTFPNFDQVFRERIDLEARLRADPASIKPEERQLLIRTPFIFLSPRVEKRFSPTHLDKEVGFSLLAAVALLVVGPGIARHRPRRARGRRTGHDRRGSDPGRLAGVPVRRALHAPRGPAAAGAVGQATASARQ